MLICEGEIDSIIPNNDKVGVDCMVCVGFSITREVSLSIERVVLRKC